MAEEIDLDLVALTPAVVEAWQEVAQSAFALAHSGRVGPAEIPDEQARVNDDGTLTIFVSIPGVIDVSLDVPADQWAYLQ